MKIISCVGDRGTAVVIPIYSILKRLKPAAVECLLLYTGEKYKTIANMSGQWLISRYKNSTYQTIPFKKDPVYMQKLTGDSKNLYFNTNPGMNWQIAYLTSFLPEWTKCIASDDATLYKWNIMENIETATPLKLESIGIDGYNELSTKIQVHCERGDINNNIKSSKIKRTLSGHRYRYSLNINGIPETILNVVNRRLIWGNERHGVLQLLFDLEGIEDNSMTYRIITEVCDPINFNVMICTSKYNVINRARTDGYNTINLKNSNYRKVLTSWIENKYYIKPKSSLPGLLQGKLRVTNDYNIKDPLVISLGDNLSPTLNAIYSHFKSNRVKSVIMVYDKYSARIGEYAERCRAVLSKRGYDVMLYESDHRGKNIHGLSDFLSKDSVINITPGTKMQTVNLASLARSKKYIQNVYTIDQNKIVGLFDENKSIPVIQSEFLDLIQCSFPSASNKEVPGNNDLWSCLLNSIAEGTIRPKTSLIDDLISENNKITVGGRNFEFTKNELRKVKEGFWWEALVANVLKKHLGAKVYWDVKWERSNTMDNSKEDVFLTELDIIFEYRNTYGVVSCKCKDPKNIKYPIEAFIAKSEARKRIGRFTLIFIAIPYEGGPDNLLNGDVLVLKPSVLRDPAKLRRLIDEIIDKKRTTKT